jgi:hypothetical protein
MLAVEAPVLKVIALGGMTLAMSAFLHHPSHRSHHRLSLHAPTNPSYLYLTRFEAGDISITRDDSDLKTVTFTTRAFVNDGCEWLGIETLVPVDGKHYAYSYDEAILSCAPDANPCIKTPRTGVVVVDE